MKTILYMQIDEKLKAQLFELAKRERRSLTQQITLILEREVEREKEGNR